MPANLTRSAPRRYGLSSMGTASARHARHRRVVALALGLAALALAGGLLGSRVRPADGAAAIGPFSYIASQ